MKKLTNQKKTLLISILISLVLISVGIYSDNIGVRGQVVALSIFIIIGPQLLLVYEKHKTLMDMENRFPSFLHDIIELIRSGTPLHQAIIITSKSDYGKLTPEIRKMANQLTWHVPLPNVLDQFTERMRGSKRMYMSLKIIKESYFSGGDIASSLESVADNLNMIIDADKEKKSILNQYVLLMYVISFVFIAIVAGINKLMVPIFTASSEDMIGALTISNPCDACTGFSCNVCGGFQATSTIFSLDPTSIGAYYTALFFWMSMIVSISNGLVAGQISDNSIKSGIKHSVIMASSTYFLFTILVFFGFLGV